MPLIFEKNIWIQGLHGSLHRLEMQSTKVHFLQVWDNWTLRSVQNFYSHLTNFENTYFFNFLQKHKTINCIIKQYYGRMFNAFE